MRLSIVQVIAALLAAVCFIIAFIATGVAVVSGGFMLLALAALGFIVWTALRRAFGRDRLPKRAPSAPAPSPPSSE